MDHKIENAEQAIRNRFTAIEAALKDLCQDAFGILTQQEIVDNKLLVARYQNRLMSMFLLIYHLRDDICRLAKRHGFKQKIVKDFAKRTIPISICIRAGDTHKHGLGGRSKNATISNGPIIVVKTAKGAKPAPSDKAIVEGMTLVDSEHGVFCSKVVIEQAIGSWVQFLNNEFNLNLTDWLRRCFPPRQGPIVDLSPKLHTTVPEGATVTFGFPQDLTQRLVDDVQKRAKES
ncbi:MAG: hypothetical protein KAQ89_04255 [Planctomycetes bacterium]|nr:hypothetical protein [Planctomycetota bacterium]